MTTRRNFIRLTAAAFGVETLGVCQALAEAPAVARSPKPRWYKGNLHCHTYWSDGRAYPDQAVKSYRDAGFDFCAITDHNRIGTDRNAWRPIVPEETGGRPTLCQKNFDLYRQNHPYAEYRTTATGSTEVRLQTMDELKARYNENGRFLLMTGVEITRADWSQGRHMHMNYINLEKLMPSCAEGDFIKGLPNGRGMSAAVREARDQIHALAAELGHPPHLVVLNHPHWRYYDLVAKDFIDNPDIRFFEVCNTGAEFPPVGLLPDDGLYCDRLWDAVNACRVQRNQALLLAVANDDCHFYPCTQTKKRCSFGDAYTCVKASELTPAALFEAMERGDSYASCGVELEDVVFDAKTGTLTVAVPADAKAAFTVRFIVSKAGCRTTPVQIVSCPAENWKNAWEGRPPRDVPVYGKGVGEIVKTVRGEKGRRLVASYTLATDDLYVRARVESSVKSPYEAALHPKFETAWTQPFVRLDRR